MYPIIFDKNTTSFNSNGIGRLSSATKCTVTEERNGEFELEMEYPITGLHFEDIKYSSIIMAKPRPKGKLQAFRVYSVTRKLNGTVEVAARHISYQLLYIPTGKLTASSAASAFQYMKEGAAENCPFNFSTDVTRAGTFTVSKPAAIRSLLGGEEGSILDIYHGEYEWDNYNVILHESRGSDKGLRIAYGKNLIDLSQEENIENTVTGIYPFYQQEDTHDTDINNSEIGQYGKGNIDLYNRPIYKNSDGTFDTLDSFYTRLDEQFVLLPRIIFGDDGEATKINNSQAVLRYRRTGEYLGKFDNESDAKEYKIALDTEQQDIYSKNLDLNKETYVELPEKILYSENASNFPYKLTEVKDFTSEFQNAPSIEELRLYTQQYISQNEIGVPKVTLEVEFVDLLAAVPDEDRSKANTLELCDIVTVDFPELGVSTKAKINKVVYNVLLERYDTIEIGDPKSDLSTTLADGLEAISDAATTDAMKQTIDRATGVLADGRRGHFIVGRNSSGWANEALFLDTDNVGAAKQVLRINKDGIGFSHNGYPGPYWQSWTSDGHLSLGGINGNYGTLTILDESSPPKPMVICDKNGLRLLDEFEGLGYLVDNVLYSNADRTETIQPKSGKYYYDYISSRIYKYSNNTYQVVTASHEAVLAKMARDGLGIYQGEIDLRWNGERGLLINKNEAGKDEMYFGDFKVNTQYGRQILESDDEMTGMSGRSEVAGEENRFLYLWAGYHTADNYRFVVNEAGAYTMYGNQRFNIGETLSNFESRISRLEEGEDPDPEDEELP